MADVQAAHIPIADLIDYLSEQMTAEFECRVTNHLESCEDCCVILEQIDEMSDDSFFLLEGLPGLDACDDEDRRLS